MSPDEFTLSKQFIDVGNGHQLYVHDWGNKQAKTPIVFLHGGPGGGCSDGQKEYFDPLVQRVIFHDQRGSGRSLPYGSLEHNTTQDLVEDIEKIAKHLKLTTFIITGGSWGSCLALAYALKYQKRITAMVLRGIFTGTSDEIAHIDQGQWRSHFPDLWAWYLSQTPASHQANPSAYHFKRILGSNEADAKESASIYSRVESALIRLDDRAGLGEDPDFDPASTRLEVYYMHNNCFMPDRYILDNVHQLKMPINIVQGRYDMVCPPAAAYTLHKALQSSWLTWTIAGHSGNDRESWTITSALLARISQEK